MNLSLADYMIHFFGVDSRDYQVVQPDLVKINEMGAQMLCLEKKDRMLNSSGRSWQFVSTPI